MIKAIETQYKGYRFRSRLEARWAVFFDALGVEWQYEPEGYDLDGVHYLPDFLFQATTEPWTMPDPWHWLEVKPGAFTAEERNKAELLCRATQRPVLFGTGVPSWPLMIEGVRPARGREIGVIDIVNDYWAWWRRGHWVSCIDGAWWKAWRDHEDEIREMGKEIADRQWAEGFLVSTWNPTIGADAVDAARSARFEHGETPRW